MRYAIKQLSDPRYRLQPLKRQPRHGTMLRPKTTMLPSKNGSFRLKDEKGENQRPTTPPEGEVCPSCGHVNERYALRCDSCGAVIDSGSPAAPEETAPEAKQEEQPGAEAPPAEAAPEASPTDAPPAEAPAVEAPPAKIVDPSPPKAPPSPAAPPPIASASDNFKLCDKCAGYVPEGSPTCPSCGALLRAARAEIVAHEAVGERYTGTVAVIIAIAGMFLFRYGPKFTLGASGLAIVVGLLAFRRDEQPALGMLAVILAILGIFGVIVAPMF